MLIKNLRCFSAKDKRSGNPAIVIQDFEGHTNEMQQFAKNSQAPACAFVFKGKSIRFFYPEMESELCIHAALCAAKVLFAQNPSLIMQLKTKSGKVLNFKQANQSYYIKTATEPSANGAIPKELIFTLLKTSDLAPDLPYQIASIGSPKLLIPLSSEKTLAQLSPNLAAIKAWSIETGVNGVYVYTQISENEFAARNFNPKTGLTEDIATGVSAGALASSLGKSIKILQGQYLGQPSCIEVNYETSDTIWVGGKVQAQ